MITKLLFTQALSPLHAGTGQGIGVIDLPIAKEKATGLPFLPGSSVKGSLRDACTDAVLCRRIFGPDSKDDNAAEYASVIQFSDQRLLFLPVRSLVGTFAWATSPYVLRRFHRDAMDVGIGGFPTTVPVPSNSETCLVAQVNAIVHQKVYLEDLDLAAMPSDGATAWAKSFASRIFDDADWQKVLGEHLCIVSDEVMSFLVDTATEVSARISLDDDKKTVKDGGLWYEESLPCETVLYGIVSASDIKQAGTTPDEAMAEIAKLLTRPMQFGGKATVGHGLCRLRFADNGNVTKRRS
jgi:CRISPR-associated protein Cmr4